MHKLRNDRKAERQKEAILRQEAYDKLTTKEKLNIQLKSGFNGKQVKKLEIKIEKCKN